MQPFPETTITTGRASDLAACARILLNSDLGRNYFGTFEKASQILKPGFDRRKVMVALRDRACAGFYWWDPAGMLRRFPYLHIIAVHADLRGQGIGTYLLRHFETAAFDTAPKVFLLVADFNPRAKKLYERCGYEEVGAIPGLFKEGVSEHLMMKIQTGEESSI